MRVNVNLIECAVVLRAEIVRTLVNRAVNVGILLIVHENQSPFRMALFCLQNYDIRNFRDYASGFILSYNARKYDDFCTAPLIRDIS